MATISTKRACDQCHNVKERCRRSDMNLPCERCSRLNQACRTTRRAVKTGRKPRCLQKLPYALPKSTGHDLSIINSQMTTPPDIPPGSSLCDGGLAANPAIIPILDECERHFLNLMKDVGAPSPLDKFLIGPSFHESHHVGFIQNFMKPIPALRHAAVACAAVLLGENNREHAKTCVEIGHKRAALAISSLRECKISNEQDLATVLVLGVAMVTFAMHVCKSESQAYLISHYTLSLINPQTQILYSLNSATIDYWMCLVCTEIFECLLKSEIPSVRVDPYKRNQAVDRYLGISSSIFAHLYDICEVGKSLKNASMATAAKAVARLASIKVEVDQWQTNPPSNFLDRYSQAEVIIMISQAKILRLAALLIIHRLQYPFGEQDREALTLGHAMIDEFDMVLQFTQRSIPCTALPYSAACFEIMELGSRESVLEKSKDIVTFSIQSRIRFETTLTSIWKARDSGHRFHWFEIGEYASTGAPGK